MATARFISESKITTFLNTGSSSVSDVSSGGLSTEIQIRYLSRVWDVLTAVSSCTGRVDTPSL